MYQIFLLDIDNTLLDFDAAEEQGFIKMIQSYDLEFHDEMLSQYKKMNRHLWDLLEQEKIGREELLIRFNPWRKGSLNPAETDGETIIHRFKRRLFHPDPAS